MRAGDLLRQLDQRLLPRLLGTLTRTGQGPRRFRVLGAAAMLSCVAVLATAVWAVDRPVVGDRTVGEVTRVGVGVGDSIPGYLRDSSAELAALLAAPPSSAGTGTYALVSLSGYLAPERLAGVFDGVAVAEVFGRVPLPGRQTQIVRIPALRVPQDLIFGMTELADRKDREAADYRTRAAAPGAGAEDRELRQVYDSGAEVAAAEAAAYRSGCSCLYAAVVRAEPAGLATVAVRPGVRAVDPAPEVQRLDRAVFTPPLPEQDEVVRPPADGALPGSPERSSPTPLPPAPALPPAGGAPAGSSADTSVGPAPTPSPETSPTTAGAASPSTSTSSSTTPSGPLPGEAPEQVAG